MNKGKFITFEGGDGAGKTTLLAHIVAFLEERGVHPLVIREPGTTSLGEKLRQILLEHTDSLSAKAEMLLFLAARAQQIEEVILPQLKEGRVILCDRFNDSTIAYQGAGRQLGVVFVQEMCAALCGEVQPDHTFYLDIDPEVGKQRLHTVQDRLEKEEISFHKRVREGFLVLARQFPLRVSTIDASQTAEQVFTKTLPLLVQVLGV